MSCNIISEKCIKQGESIEYSWSIDGGVALTNWTCYVQVRYESSGQLTAIDLPVTTKNLANTAFILNLTKDDTGALTPGKYIVGAEFENSVTEQCAEFIERLVVERQWVIKP